MYRDNPRNEELEQLRSELQKSQEAQEKLRRRLWNGAIIILAAIPPALVLKYHAPGRILLVDVLGFSIWVALAVMASRNRG